MNVFTVFSFDDFIRYWLATVVLFAWLFALIYTIWGGFLMIISGWAEEKVKAAVNHIRYAFIGVIFMVVVLFAFPFFARMLSLEYGQYAEPSTIFSTISEISARIFWTYVVPNDWVLQDSSSLPSNFSDL